MKSSLGFEILDQRTSSPPHSTKVVGVRTVKCPRCGNVFTQGGSGGCFTMLWTPINCPSGCGFPWPEKNQSSVTKEREDII